MSDLFSFLQSRGKTGGVILMLIGIGEFVAIGFGKLDNSHLVEAGGSFGLGLSLFGIRAAIPPAPPSPPAS